jgi:hypothetical protein
VSNGKAASKTTIAATARLRIGVLVEQFDSGVVSVSPS